jgi:hypothetical protein
LDKTTCRLLRHKFSSPSSTNAFVSCFILAAVLASAPAPAPASATAAAAEDGEGGNSTAAVLELVKLVS